MKLSSPNVPNTVTKKGKKEEREGGGEEANSNIPVSMKRNDYIQIKKKLAVSQIMHKNINNLSEPQIPQNP